MARPQFLELQAHLDAMDLIPLRTLCVFCEWSCEGTTAQCRESALQHRLQAHPDLIENTVRKRSHLKSFRQPRLKQNEWKEVYAERDKRAKLLGIEISDT